MPSSCLTVFLLQRKSVPSIGTVVGVYALAYHSLRLVIAAVCVRHIPHTANFVRLLLADSLSVVGTKYGAAYFKKGARFRFTW